MYMSQCGEALYMCIVDITSHVIISNCRSWENLYQCYKLREKYNPACCGRTCKEMVGLFEKIIITIAITYHSFVANTYAQLMIYSGYLCTKMLLAPLFASSIFRNIVMLMDKPLSYY